jgi:hypothetical protein
MAKLELRRGSLLAGAFFLREPQAQRHMRLGPEDSIGSGDYVAASALTQACAVPRSLRFPELTLRALAGLGTSRPLRFLDPWSAQIRRRPNPEALGGQVTEGYRGRQIASCKRDFVRMLWGFVPSWWPKPLKDLRAATSTHSTRTPGSGSGRA